MKTVLILGAGPCQVPLIEKCRARGLRVLVASRPGAYPGFDLADQAYRVDVRDKERLRAVAAAERVAAVLTDQTDIPVSTAAWIAERLGLPGIGYACAQKFTDKQCMRRACAELGIPGPRYCVADRLAPLAQWADASGYPVIVKPVDSQGSRGVQLVRTPAELAAAFAEAAPHAAAGQVLAEEFVAGREVVIQGFAAEGRFTNLVIGDRRYFNLPGRFIPQATLFPSTLAPELQARLGDLNRRLVTGFGLPFGITHSEYLVRDDGDIRLVEVAARGGGVFISSDLVPLACGVDVNDLLIRCALGERPAFDPAALRPAAAGYVCFALPAGEISRPPNAAELAALPGVHRACLAGLTLGARVADLSDKTGRQGPILLRAQSRAGLDALHRRVRETLRVEVTTAAGVRGPVWD